MLGMAGSLSTEFSVAFVRFIATLFGRLGILQPDFMLPAALSKSSAWDLTSKSRFRGAQHFGGNASISVCTCVPSEVHLLLSAEQVWAGLQRCSSQRSKRNEGRCDDLSGPVLQQEVGRMQVGNCTWENGQAEHGLLCPVALTQLTALVLAKH